MIVNARYNWECRKWSRFEWRRRQTNDFYQTRFQWNFSQKTTRASGWNPFDESLKLRLLSCGLASINWPLVVLERPNRKSIRCWREQQSTRANIWFCARNASEQINSLTSWINPFKLISNACFVSNQIQQVINSAIRFNLRNFQFIHGSLKLTIMARMQRL